MLMEKVFCFVFVIMPNVLPPLCEVVTCPEFLEETVTNTAPHTESGV